MAKWSILHTGSRVDLGVVGEVEVHRAVVSTWVDPAVYRLSMGRTMVDEAK